MMRRLLTEIGEYLRNPTGLTRVAELSINDELRFHLEESVREGVEDGLSIDEARRQALARFGDVESAFRECAYGEAEGHIRCHKAHLAITVGLLLALVSVGTWMLVRPAADTGDLQLTGDIKGYVLDANALPIEGAHVLAVVKTWPDGGFRQQAHTTVTRHDGTFTIGDVYSEHDDYEVQIAVLANGRVMDSSYFEKQHGPLAPTRFQLQPSTPLAVRIEAADGMPLAGVEVFPFQRVARDGAEDAVYFCSAEPVTLRSNDAGQVTMPYFSPGDKATVYLRVPGGEWDTRDFAVSDEEQVVVIRMKAGETH